MELYKLDNGLRVGMSDQKTVYLGRPMRQIWVDMCVANGKVSVGYFLVSYNAPDELIVQTLSAIDPQDIRYGTVHKRISALNKLVPS